MLVSDALIHGTGKLIHGVLILVLVDVGLGLRMIGGDGIHSSCLNPCFSGCWSRTIRSGFKRFRSLCLNPCFSGCWSRTILKTCTMNITTVLILVLVDVGLGLLHTGAVSIKNTNGLNPCFSGCWSRTRILDA